MLIFAAIAINVAAVAIWSAVHGANGFKEVGNLIRGQPAFIPPSKPDGVEVSEETKDYYGEDYDPTKGAISEGTGRPNVYDPRFGVHPSELYE